MKGIRAKLSEKSTQRNALTPSLNRLLRSCEKLCPLATPISLPFFFFFFHAVYTIHCMHLSYVYTWVSANIPKGIIRDCCTLFGPYSKCLCTWCMWRSCKGIHDKSNYFFFSRGICVIQFFEGYLSYFERGISWRPVHVRLK